MPWEPVFGVVVLGAVDWRFASAIVVLLLLLTCQSPFCPRSRSASSVNYGQRMRAARVEKRKTAGRLKDAMGEKRGEKGKVGLQRAPAADMAVWV